MITATGILPSIYGFADIYCGKSRRGRPILFIASGICKLVDGFPDACKPGSPRKVKTVALMSLKRKDAREK